MIDLDFVILSGVLIIGSLLGYLAWLLWQIGAQRRHAAAVNAELAARNQEQHEHRRKSMELIALAVIDGDCDLSEACIRIKHLLDYYPGFAADPSYGVIAQMYAEVAVFATHEARAQLSSKARALEDRQRYQIEQRYGNDFLVCMRALHAHMRSLEGSRFDIDEAVGIPGTSVTSSSAAA